MLHLHFCFANPPFKNVVKNISICIKKAALNNQRCFLFILNLSAWLTCMLDIILFDKLINLC